MTKSLPPHELERHRAALGLELEVMSRKLDRFGWDQMDPTIRTRLRADWADALADFTIDEVQAACREALGGKPAEAMNEERIAGIVQRNRGRVVASLPKPAEPFREREPVDKGAAQAIVDAAGFGVKRFGDKS